MSDHKPVLTRKDLIECGHRFCFMNAGTFGYERQLAPSSVFAQAKALRKIYPDDDDYQKSLLNQFKYFNTMPYMCNLLLSAGLAMEDAEGLDALESVQDLKVGLMGPLAGIGDSLGWILLPTIFGSIAGYMGQNGNPFGALIWAAAYLALWIWRHYWWTYGYKMGASFISSVSGQLTAFTEAASILGLFVVGAMIPNTVSVSTGLTFTYGEVSLPIQTGVLDLIFPCLLPALLTWLVYTLLKRGVKMVYIIFGIIIVGWIGAATGILV